MTTEEDRPGHWLIDGMNLIGSKPNRWWEDRGRAIRQLIQELEEHARRTGASITVVFDFRPKGLRVGTAGGIKVRFAEGGSQAADRMIVEMVREHPDPDALTVVTSDRPLGESVRAAGAGVIGVGTFRRYLESG